MKKIIIEVEDDLKWDFVESCTKVRRDQKKILTMLIENWLKEKTMNQKVIIAKYEFNKNK